MIRLRHLFLGGLISMSSVTFASEITKEIYDNKPSYHQMLATKIDNLIIDDLGCEHHLPNSFLEILIAKDVFNTGSELLNKGNVIESLPYFIYAEKFYEYESLSILWNISVGGYNYKQKVSPEILDNLNSQIKKLIPAHKRIQDIIESHKVLWQNNYNKLVKAPSFMEQLKEKVGILYANWNSQQRFHESLPSQISLSTIEQKQD